MFNRNRYSSQPLMLRRDYGSTYRQARFPEGEEGRKKFMEWKAEQPKEFQEQWDEMNEEYGDKFKKKARFPEGEEGRKKFMEWKAEQPKEFQEQWDEMNEEYGDKFKKKARFPEGEEGRKKFMEWKAEQPKEFQEQWDEMNDEYGDKFKKKARFPEGEEGRKKFMEWKAEQPKEFQEQWDEMNDEYGDKFKKKASLKIASVKIASIESDMDKLLAKADRIEEKAKKLKTAWKKKDLNFLKKSKVLTADELSDLNSSYETIKDAQDLVKSAVKDLMKEARTHRKEARKLGKKASYLRASCENGDYMSVSHIQEMVDMVSILENTIKEGVVLEDWVESKIAHAHQILSDLTSYFVYSESDSSDNGSNGIL